jgi:UDP-N-acetylglucosamine/UDP-N-acetylgalactosamine diphosphorylase
MADEGIIDDMRAKGIEWVFVGSVDNALVKNVDPILIGLTKIQGNEIGSKSIAKAYPQERVGVFCKKNGYPAVIEYSEIPEEMTEEVDEDGELLYGEANIMNHVYTLDAIEKISKEELPYHSAHKKADMTMVDGTVIKATEPNAYKYEAFIFDGFKFFNNMTLVRGVRENEFAPVKNAEGKDSPATAVELYNNYWKL